MAASASSPTAVSPLASSSRYRTNPGGDIIRSIREQGDRQRHKLLYGALWMSLDFQTWHALVGQQGFEDDEVIDLMVGMMRCLMHT
jgi:hypothetical protein